MQKCTHLVDLENAAKCKFACSATIGNMTEQKYFFTLYHPVELALIQHPVEIALIQHPVELALFQLLSLVESVVDLQSFCCVLRYARSVVCLVQIVSHVSNLS